jgi:hypothetical protein
VGEVRINIIAQMKKIRRTAPLVLLVVGLAGCAGHSLKCEDATALSGCPPDSAAGQAMKQKQEEIRDLSEIDEARCTSHGSPGSQLYSQCLAQIKKDRLVKP